MVVFQTVCTPLDSARTNQSNEQRDICYFLFATLLLSLLSMSHVNSHTVNVLVYLHHYVLVYNLQLHINHIYKLSVNKLFGALGYVNIQTTHLVSKHILFIIVKSTEKMIFHQLENNILEML